MRRFLLLTVLSLLAYSTAGFSQTTVTVVPANRPITVTADKSPASDQVTKYSCYVGNTADGEFTLFQEAPADQPGSRFSCVHPGLPPGVFFVKVSATNIVGEGEKSDPAGGDAIGNVPGKIGNVIISVQIVVQQP